MERSLSISLHLSLAHFRTPSFTTTNEKTKKKEMQSISLFYIQEKKMSLKSDRFALLPVDGRGMRIGICYARWNTKVIE